MEFFSFDEAYLKRLRERDFPTEQHFVAYFRQLLMIKLRSRLRSSQAVDDIAQETFLRVLRRCRRRAGSGSRSAWERSLTPFATTCYRSSTDRSDHGTPINDDAPEPVDKVIDLEGFLVSKQTREQVRKVLEQLGEKDRQLLRSIFLEEKEKDEVCREFGVDRDYLRVLLHRAKQSFRVFYEKSQADGLPTAETMIAGR